MKQTWPGTAHVAVDPDNRLVARSLERDWNEKLLEAERLQREYAALPKPTALCFLQEKSVPIFNRNLYQVIH